MGAWDFTSFGNDTAADWGHELAETSDLSLVERALRVVVDEAGILDMDVASEGIAAAEVVARLLGRNGTQDAYSQSVDDWVAAHPMTVSRELVGLALLALQRVQTEPSELLDELQDEEEWMTSLDDLRRRVSGTE